MKTLTVQDKLEFKQIQTLSKYQSTYTDQNGDYVGKNAINNEKKRDHPCRIKQD